MCAAMKPLLARRVDETGTELSNLWRICTHHHGLKTHGGWRAIGGPGNWDLVPPDDPDPP